MKKIEKLISFVRTEFKSDDFIPLHAPKFLGNEKQYLNKAIDSTFVSSVGEYVDQFEEMLESFCGCKKSVAVVNGTCGIQVALSALGVKKDDLVITQSLTFVATANAIKHCGADPVFIDSSEGNISMSSSRLRNFLSTQCEFKDGILIHKESGRRISACAPVHIFGYSCDIDDIIKICKEFNLKVVEDAAEGLGTKYKGQHLGTFGDVGVISFNGNKIVTTGGGGALITNDIELGKRLKHLTTTAKRPHSWEYDHDEIGFNYRMPNLNAALGCAQLEQISRYIEVKEKLSSAYKTFCLAESIQFYEPDNISDTEPNYWLNSIVVSDRAERELFLKELNSSGIMSRPLWIAIPRLVPFENDFRTDLKNSTYFEDRLISLPSSPVLT